MTSDPGSPAHPEIVFVIDGTIPDILDMNPAQADYNNHVLACGVMLACVNDVIPPWRF